MTAIECVVIGIGLIVAFIIGIAVGYRACRQIQKEERLAYSGEA